MNAFALKSKSQSIYTISGLLDQKCLEEFLKFIQNSVSDECTRLHIRICSSGGHVSIALAMGQLIRTLPCEVFTYNIANVDSAAIAVFASGKQRVCAPYGVFMFHPAAKEISGAKNAAELRALADEIDSDEDRLVSFLECCTGTSKSVWKRKMAESTRLTAETALSDNLVTEIEQPRT
ncbi:MAG: ATP-dependent Clp protease proteolytic subunit [Kiritimatiellia bacterium]